MRLPAAGGAGLDLARRAELEMDAAGPRKRRHAGVAKRADAVADAPRAENFDGLADIVRALRLAGVDRDGKLQRLEQRQEGPRRDRLVAREIEAREHVGAAHRPGRGLVSPDAEV